MEVRLLGPVELIGDSGAAVAVGGPKERALLAVLACHPGQVVSEDRLIDALWGDLPPRTATRTLQSYLSRLRRTIAQASPDAGGAVQSTPAGWQLRLAPEMIDVTRVESLGERGRSAAAQGDHLGAALAYADALRSWRGRPLEEFSDHAWAIVEAGRLEELRQAIAEERAEAELACGRHAELVGDLEALCRAHPLRERPWAQLMVALYRSGRQAEALRVYQELRRTLGEELGIEPSPTLARLEQQILLQDPALEWGPGELVERASPLAPPDSPVDSPVDSAATGVVEESGQSIAPLPNVLAALAEVTFVGRDSEIKALDRAWQLARDGYRQVTLIAGEPGIGKTTLAARVAAAARGQGSAVLFGRCDEESLVAFQPFVEAIGYFVETIPPGELRVLLGDQAADLALLVPSVGRRLPELSAVVGTGAETERYRIFEAVSAFFSALGGQGPFVLVLDDLHWADRPTLGLFQHLIRRTSHVPMLIIGTYRDTDLVRTHPMAETLADLRRADLVSRVSLRGLSALDVLSLVTGGQPAQPGDKQLADEMWAETEGSPLFLREILRHLEETGAAYRDETGRWCPRRRIDQLGIPEGVKEVIGRRLSRLSDAANVALRTGSVLGRQIRLDVLEVVTDLTTDRLLDAMDEAVAAGVIDEVPSVLGRWTFTHALVRQALYDELSLSRRVRLHQRVGEALELLDPGEGPQLAELAYHFAQAAVSGTADKAIAYAWQAGEHAMTLAAYEQAAKHFAMALEVAEDAGTDIELQADLLLAQGNAEWRAANPTIARATFERVLKLVGDDPERLARAALGYAGAGIRPMWVEMFVVNERVIGLLETALDALPGEDGELRARVLACLAQELYFDVGSEHRRDELSVEAVAMARRLGDPGTLAYVLCARNLATLSVDRATELDANAEEMWAIGEALGDRQIEADGLRFRFFYCTVAQWPEVLVNLERWEAVIDELKDPASACVDKWLRGLLATLEGRFEDAERLAIEGFRLGQEIRDRNAIGGSASVLAVLRFYQGRMAEIFSALIACLDAYPSATSWAYAVLASAYADLDMDTEAREWLERLEPMGPHSLPRTLMWPFALSHLGRAYYRLQDVSRAAAVYDLLLPFANTFGLGGSIGGGSLNLPLACVASTIGKIDDAEHHFEAALSINAANGWRPGVAETQVHYARMLVTRGKGTDRDRAREMLDAAAATAAELGMALVLRESTELRAQLTGPSKDGLPPVERRRGRAVTRRDKARAKLTAGGLAAVARWTRNDSDEDLIRRFGSSVAQRALFAAIARSFQPAMAFGFTGDLVFELRAPDDEADPSAADWWTIEIRGRKASSRRGRSSDPSMTIHIGLADAVRLASGEVHPVRALIENRVEVEGDFMLAARLPDMFGAVEPQEGLARSITG